MSFDIKDLREKIDAHDRVVRVVIADIKGSSPREVGASVVVWNGGQSGTIGGGALEYQAAQAAMELTQNTLTHHPLGPSLGQCCGGTVTLLSEIYDAKNFPDPSANFIARGTGDMPLKVARHLANARSQGCKLTAQLVSGWMIEAVSAPSRPIWIWGAGHVGRAIVNVLNPVPDFDLTWIDTSPDRFPSSTAQDIKVVPATDPAALIKHAPAHAEHFILTYSHELDLRICHNLLNHQFRFAGLIGSKTKWARFQSRLQKLGHDVRSISRITCPIGQPDLGKHPHAIAIGIASGLLSGQTLEYLREKNA